MDEAPNSARRGWLKLGTLTVLASAALLWSTKPLVDGRGAVENERAAVAGAASSAALDGLSDDSRSRDRLSGSASETTALPVPPPDGKAAETPRTDRTTAALADSDPTSAPQVEPVTLAANVQPSPPSQHAVDAEGASSEETSGLVDQRSAAQPDGAAAAARQTGPSLGRLDSRIVVHLNVEAGIGPSLGVIQALIDAGYPQPELHRVDVPVGSTNIRYFFADDRPDAARIDGIVAASLGDEPPAGPRDFTDYRPLPVANTVEVWIAN